MRKTAEQATTDAGKFPEESCRERLARKWGLDAVALSGPCEGRPLCECVCEQLDSRWNKLKDRYAGKTDKVVRLASKLAESYMRRDDTTQCVSDLESMGFTKESASGISSYLKAYAMDDVAEDEIDELDKDVESEDELEDVGENLEDVGEDITSEGDELEDVGLPEEADELEDVGDELEDVGNELEDVGAPDLGAPDVGLDMGTGGEDDMVVIEIPREVALELDEFLDKAIGEHEEPVEEGLPAKDEVLPGSEDVVEEPLAKMDGVGVEIVTELPPDEPESPDIPGETEESPVDTGKQFVTGDEEPEVEVENACKTCGRPMVKHKEEKKEKEEGCSMASSGGEKKEEEKACGPSCGSKKADGDKSEGEGGDKSAYASAVRNMRSGHVSSVKFSWLNKFAEEQMLRLGPEMSINNTDQQAGGKPLGKAKEKAVEAPKPLSEGNVHPEGHTAGGNKFQDGKTMGREEKFDAAKVSSSDVSQGEASLMGKNESIPKGGPDVPSQETQLMTKGTVIAELRPEGVLVMAGGKKFLAKHPISKPTAELIASVKAIPFDGDGKKFALAVLKLLKKAEEQPKTDSGKVEGNLTNDPEPPKEGKGPKKGKPTGKVEDGVKKIDTGKKEGDDFQNDPQKPKKASAEKEVKVAKEIEAPKPLEDGNVKCEGHSAGDSKFQDGKTMGHEQKFDADEVNKSEVSKGDASRMGNEEPLGLKKPDVPNPPDKGKLGNEELEGGDRSTKGTVIAEVEEQKRKADENLMASKVKEARLKAASVLVADMLANGEIEKAQYSEHLERYSALPVPAIQALASSLVSQREKIAKKSEASAQAKAPGMSLPVVVQSASREQSLKDKLVSFSSLTQKCDKIDQMRDK